jgi:endonuclease/exonuclease/phosphatase family metal-dependent hydrolase
MKWMIKILIMIVLMVCTGVRCCARDSLLVMFWNLENFFDYVDGGEGESDMEFSPEGARHWTKTRFYAKCDAVAKAIMWTADSYGRMPDMIGLAEIENKGVLDRLLRSTALRKYDYRIIHYDSSDRRGIDVAILYRSSSMTLISTSVKTPQHEGQKLPTRDILHAQMCLPDASIIDFIVNHHPSKFSGSKQTESRRTSAMQAMLYLCDSLSSPRIIAMGDFNDHPDSHALRLAEGTLINKSAPLHKAGQGTIRYEGKWELIDQFLVSPSLSDCTQMYICCIPFLMVRDTKHPGEKPLRTYTGPRYTAGVSDHCPILLSILP